MQRLLAVFADLKIEAKVLEQAAHNEKIGYLLGLSGFSASEQSAESFEFSDGAVVFHNIASKRLDKVLARLRQDELFIPYKAVVTPTNRFWKLSRLCLNMKKEHGAMIEYQKNAQAKGQNE